jgi:S-adenosylmethionine hydrolase
VLRHDKEVIAGPQELPMIALFTDFGSRDAYVAQMKGVILQINPHVQLVDINHEVDPFDLRAATYLLATSAYYFPAGSIFVAVVDPGVGSSRLPLLVHTQVEKWYIGPDNGIFTGVLAREGLRAAYALTQPIYFRAPQVSTTFHGRDIFAPVAAHLSLGVPPAHFGPRRSEVLMLPQAQPQRVGDSINGEVRYIDHFGNVITNITAALLQDVPRGRRVTCILHDTTYRVPFVHTYAEGAPHELICLINSDDAFELAISQEAAAASVHARIGDRFVLRCDVEESAEGVV